MDYSTFFKELEVDSKFINWFSEQSKDIQDYLRQWYLTNLEISDRIVLHKKNKPPEEYEFNGKYFAPKDSYLKEKVEKYRTYSLKRRKFIPLFTEQKIYKFLVTNDIKVKSDYKISESFLQPNFILKIFTAKWPTIEKELKQIIGVV